MRGETHRCRNDSSPEVGFAIRIKSRYYLTSLYHINITALLLLSEIQMNPIRKHVPTATASLGTRTCAIHATERKCSHSYPPRKEFQCNLSAAETRLTAAVYPELQGALFVTPVILCEPTLSLTSQGCDLLAGERDLGIAWRKQRYQLRIKHTWRSLVGKHKNNEIIVINRKI